MFNPRFAIPSIVAIDGMDGCGKTTFVKEFEVIYQEYDLKYEVLHMAPKGELLDVILKAKDLTDHQLAGLFRVLADQAAGQIKAANMSGKHVILDRSPMSWMVYQGYVPNNLNSLKFMDKGFPKFPKESALIYLRADAELCYDRVIARAEAEGKSLDSFENRGIDYFKKIEEGYDFFISKRLDNTLEPAKTIVLDAADDSFLNASIAFDLVFEINEQGNSDETVS